MNRTLRWRITYLTFITMLGTAVTLGGAGGCGSGSGSSTTTTTTGNGTALEIADQMSLVTAAESGTAANLSKLVSLMKFTAPSGSDYETDEAELWVYDESMQVLDLINEILCSVEQTKYGDMVNDGNYLAMIDIDACSGRHEDQSSEGSNQSSGEQREFESWVVNSSRTDDASPQIVRFWVESEPTQEDPFEEIRAELTITEGKSDTNPFGIFSMNFVGYLDGAALMTGNLTSSNTEDGLADFQMVIDGGEFFQEETHAIITPDGSSGTAYVNNSGAMGKDGGGAFHETVSVAFDSAHYLADFGDKTKCLDRENFRKNVWEYNLYTADGARVARDSGMEIRVGSSEEDFGWADYYGVWLPEHLGALSPGDTVTNGDGTASYTIFQGGGRLIRRTREDLTLGDFLNDIFYLWEQESAQTYLVRWDGTNLVKFAIDQCGPTGCSQITIPEEVVTLTPFAFIGLWKQGLGNLDIVVPESGVLSNDLSVPLYKEEFVTPSDAIFASGDLDLKCYSMCPVAPLTAELFDTGALFEEDIMDNDTAPYTYTVSADDMTLKREGEDVSIALGAEVDASSPNFWGMRSGAMLPTSATLENFWEAWSQETQYMWEAGPNTWNFYTGLLDANGEAVEFEAPLKCLYQNAENGTYYLDYHGEGRLFGIPFEEVASEDGEFTLWIAQFILDEGTELDCDGTPMYTKAMAIEQTMAEVDVSTCAGLSTEGIEAPTNGFTDPELDAAPTVTTAPAVIGGVLQ
ncbi:MAG: hypothetical protein HYV02_05705 [Deltaproteobacteria bacterium]|nr:hypothetical protein [Deltaproteobacteria bacterium]